MLASSPLPGATLEAVPGEPAAPGFVLSDLEGKRRTLEEFRGKVVLVNFWASWCPPCLQEMPSLERLAEAMADRPFAVVAVNVGESRQRVRETLRRLRYRGMVLLDPDRRTYKAWGVRVLPTSFLVGPRGHLRFRVLGDVDWQADDTQRVVEALISEAR